MRVCPNCRIKSRIICNEVFRRRITVYDVFSDKDNAFLIPYKSWWNEKEDDEESISTKFTCETCGFEYDGFSDVDVVEEMEEE